MVSYMNNSEDFDDWSFDNGYMQGFDDGCEHMNIHWRKFLSDKLPEVYKLIDEYINNGGII